jgi:hypothetical protein
MLTVAAVMVRAWSEATKAATLPTSSSVAARPSIVIFSISPTILSRPLTLSGIVSGTPPVRRGHGTHAVRSKLAGAAVRRTSSKLMVAGSPA